MLRGIYSYMYLKCTIVPQRKLLFVPLTKFGQIHCKNEYALSNQLNCGNRLQAILFIKLNKLELSNS